VDLTWEDGHFRFIAGFYRALWPWHCRNGEGVICRRFILVMFQTHAGKQRSRNCWWRSQNSYMFRDYQIKSKNKSEVATQMAITTAALNPIKMNRPTLTNPQLPHTYNPSRWCTCAVAVLVLVFCVAAVSSASSCEMEFVCSSSVLLCASLIHLRTFTWDTSSLR